MFKKLGINVMFVKYFFYNHYYQVYFVGYIGHIV